MAGTLPHAVFVETGLDPAGSAVAFAAELPGCAVVAADAETAVVRVPARVAAFTAWLRSCGEDVAEPVGNWYEVERAAATIRGDSRRRAAFSLDDLPPAPDEFETWMHWLELARESLAKALDRSPATAAELGWLAGEDRALAAELTGLVEREAPEDPMDALYAARDELSDALVAAGAGGAGVRRALRLAIADDLWAMDLVGGG